MTTRLVFNHWADWLLPGNPNDTRLFHADSSDRILVCPPHLGQGYFQEISVRDDMTLLIFDYTLNQDVVMEGPGLRNCLEFSFQLVSSDTEYTSFYPHFGSRQLFVIPARQRFFKIKVYFKQPALITYCQAFIERLSPQAYSTAELIFQSIYRAQGRVSKATVAEMVSQLMQRMTDSTPTTFAQSLSEQIYREVINLYYVSCSLVTPAMKQVIGQILSCPYHKATRRTYLEGKALELVDLRLQEMVQPRLRETELDCIYQAAFTLRNQLVNPPTVEALARRVGTNRLYLNRGFHELYGTTPFAYSRNCRLWEAQRLLMTSELPVGKVAAAVGYTNCSHFARAFRQYMGFNPKTFQMEAWQWFS